MSKKKRLKEIEALKLQVDNLQKLNTEIKEKHFSEDFEMVIKTLEKYGHIEWTIDYERHPHFMEKIINRKYTLVFNY